MSNNDKDNCRKGNDETLMEDSLAPMDTNDPLVKADKEVHVYGDKHVCSTDTRGYKNPRNMDPAALVLHAPSGFIPLWAKDVTLRWRFNESSMNYFQNPEGAKNAIRNMFADAILQWQDAVPVQFSENSEAWDFEIFMKNQDDCDSNGCVLASAFFPDAGRHRLNIYPRMLQQNDDGRIETLVHEIGHIFGLRHFFAQVSENAWPSVIFGSHNPFTIMNYGSQSMLTPADISDLIIIYEKARSRELTHINGTKIVLVTPYHNLLCS